MNIYLRNALVIILSLAVGIGLIMLVQGIGHQIFKPPPGVSSGDPAAIKEYIETAPFMALVMVPLSYLVGGIGAALCACRFSKGDNSTIAITGVILLALTIMTLADIAHPTWMAIANVLGSVLPIALGLYLAPRCRD